MYLNSEENMNSEIVETNVSLQMVESIFQLIRSLPKLIQKTIAQILLERLSVMTILFITLTALKPARTSV